MKHLYARLLYLGVSASLMLSGSAVGQSHRPLHFPKIVETHACPDEVASPAEESRNARLSYVAYLRTAAECSAPSGDGWRLDDEHPQTTPAGAARDPIEDEFLGMGAAGYVIAAARQQVILILRENSSCSVWYAEGEPNPVTKFASLHFHIDSEGEDTVISDYNFLGRYYRQPYVASAQQSVGAGSVITLNAHGAFFLVRAPVKVHSGAGRLVQPPPRLLHIGSYSGGSLNGQVTTLLHEFGHIVGLLPIDSGEANSAQVSTQNTEVVLNHCRKQIEASANRTMVLPASLAQFDRLALTSGN
ncbi:MAG TPA: hypothetical protein VN749_21110 [Candidatus Eisenbacteria bacterium]|nr:hypothetical protein [Candidatus Eisenbacteria bacterium]